MMQLVLNAGSSSVKYALFRSDVTDGSVSHTRLDQGLAEGIGTENHCRIKHENENGKETHKIPLPDHKSALKAVFDLLPQDIVSQISCVGHRVVHGGQKFQEAALVNAEVLQAIEDACVLAPLHNPWGLLGIRSSMELLGPQCRQVAVFDTAFHQTMEPHAYLYALPYELYEKHGIRKYGFHGTSYKYCLEQLALELGKPADEVNCIMFHIGNGCSMAAIRKGKCVDTTMGLTPAEGLVMGTRTGDLDPTFTMFMTSALGYTAKETAELINKKSGLLGLSGTMDDREIEQGYLDGDPKHILTKKIQVHRMRKYLGAFIVGLDGQVDAISFAGGLAEKSSLLRKLVCENLESLGIAVDESRNQADGGRFSANTPVHVEGSSRTKIWVIPTDEELCIVKQAYDIVTPS
jgi:acetate kinase|eukprot:TRINITY_DN61419_c0_g1_i1.p1 TRINITY_DN61419_c0_g1~~TRINITY_DN61419_c0_g1_i1.p1  ORF type:complete len:406 (+),score=53.52 TRINITY_DN61419_c0_g1_i1:89-1306(+)